MFRTLLKFLFTTRFTKPMIIAIVVFLAYAIGISSLGLPLVEPSPLWSYYATGIIVFFLSIMIPFGGIVIMKPDLDYLFTLPLKRRELALSFYITQFFATGITFLFAFGYILPYIAHSYLQIAVVAADLIMVALMITAFSILAYSLSMQSKIILAILMALWTLSPILGFQYSYTSMFFGNLTMGTIFSAAINIPANYLAIKQLETIELGFTKVSVRSSSDIYKNQVAYGNYSGRKSIYMYNLLQLNMTSRMNLGASTSSRSARVKVHYLIIPMVIFSIIYVILARMYDTGEDLNVVVLIVSVYIGMFIPILFSQSVLSYERAWLAFTSMPPYIYWRNVVLAKFTQMLIMVLPFFFASLYLYFTGISVAINTLPLFAITIPSVAVIVMYLSGLITMDQIKEVGTISSQFSLRQMLIILPVILVFGLVIISLMIWQAALLSCAVMGILMLLITLRKGAWTNLVYRLTERGYV